MWPPPAAGRHTGAGTGPPAAQGPGGRLAGWCMDHRWRALGQVLAVVGIVGPAGSGAPQATVAR